MSLLLAELGGLLKSRNLRAKDRLKREDSECPFRGEEPRDITYLRRALKVPWQSFQIIKYPLHIPQWISSALPSSNNTSKKGTFSREAFVFLSYPGPRIWANTGRSSGFTTLTHFFIKLVGCWPDVVHVRETNWQRDAWYYDINSVPHLRDILIFVLYRMYLVSFLHREHTSRPSQVLLYKISTAV